MVAGIGGNVGDGLVARLEELLGDVQDGATATPARVEVDQSRRQGAGAHEGVGPGAPSLRRPQLSDRPPRPLRARAPRDDPRGRHVVSTLHRGPRATRPRLLRLRLQPGLHRHRHAVRAGRASTSPASTTPIRTIADGVRDGSPPSRWRSDELEKAAQLRQGTARALARGPEGDGRRSGCAVRCSRTGSASPTRCSPASMRSRRRTCSGWRRTIIREDQLNLALIGPFEDPERFEPLLALSA